MKAKYISPAIRCMKIHAEAMICSSIEQVQAPTVSTEYAEENLPQLSKRHVLWDMDEEDEQ